MKQNGAKNDKPYTNRWHTKCLTRQAFNSGCREVWAVSPNGQSNRVWQRKNQPEHMEKTQRLPEWFAMKIFDKLYPEASSLQKKILKSTSKAHRFEWLESDRLSSHYKINQQKIDKEIDQMLSAEHPLIMIREESRSIRLTDFGRAIKKWNSQSKTTAPSWAGS